MVARKKKNKPKTLKKASKKTAKKAKTKKKSVKKTQRKSTRKKTGAKSRLKRLSAKERKEFSDLLLTLRERFTGQIEALKGDSLIRLDSVVSEEDGTDTFERQFALDLASSDHDVLFEIDNALRRIAQGVYGICETCEKLIEKPRLKALPERPRYVFLCAQENCLDVSHLDRYLSGQLSGYRAAAWRLPQCVPSQACCWRGYH